MPTPANLVHETSTSTGTGNLTLSSENGKQTFANAFSTGGTDVFDYFVSNRSAAEWERGTGHMSDATTLVRDTVLESTNGGSAVDFTAGTKDVTNDVPAGKQVTTEGEVAFTSYLDFEERTDPSNPSADTMRAYARDDGSGNTEMVLLDSAGNEIIHPQPLLHVRDEKASGTHAGNAANGGTQIRDLNATVVNEIAGASLGSNVITLPAGTYEIFATAPYKRCDGTQLRLLNDTDTVELLRGTSVFQEDNTLDAGGLLVVAGRFTLAAEKDVAIQQYTGSDSGNSLGLASGSGWGEIYTDVRIWKVR